jgi:hypothetical protein
MEFLKLSKCTLRADAIQHVEDAGYGVRVTMTSGTEYHVEHADADLVRQFLAEKEWAPCAKAPEPGKMKPVEKGLTPEHGTGKPSTTTPGHPFVHGTGQHDAPPSKITPQRKE